MSEKLKKYEIFAFCDDFTDVPNNENNQEEKLTSYQDSKYSLDSYDPLVDTQIKPPYSFASLIFMAIDSSSKKALPVKDIYKWITDNFPYFKDAPIGWKNSVRHNLSLSRCFVKSNKNYNLSKGFLWTVDKKYRDGILQTINNQNLLLTQPELLLEREKSLFRERESYLDDIDAAAVMLVIKHSNNGNGAATETNGSTSTNGVSNDKSNEHTPPKISGSSKRKRSSLEMKTSTYIDNTSLLSPYSNRSKKNIDKLTGMMSDDHNYTTAEDENGGKTDPNAKNDTNTKNPNIAKDDVDGVSALLNLSRNDDGRLADDEIEKEMSTRFLPRLLRTAKKPKKSSGPQV